MPRVARKVTQADDAVSSVLVALERGSRQRRHRFDLAVLQGIEGAAEVRATLAVSGLVVEVVNHLPHALPTGDYGPSRIEARIDFRDARGTSLARRVLSWSARGSHGIPAYGRDRRTLPPVAGAVRCVVVLVRPGGRDVPDLVLARREVDLR